AAPNSLAPTGLAHSTRVPSIDHSHAGRALVACTASRGSPTPCNWNSALFIVSVRSLLLGFLRDDGVRYRRPNDDSLNGALVSQAGSGRSTVRAGPRHPKPR